MGALREFIAKRVEEGDLISTAQTADLMGVSLDRVRSWIHSGDLPAIKIGGGLHGSDEYIVTFEDLADFTPPRIRTRKDFIRDGQKYVKEKMKSKRKPPSPKSVSCPQCGVDAGQRCIATRGKKKPVINYHKARAQFAATGIG